MSEEFLSFCVKPQVIPITVFFTYIHKNMIQLRPHKSLSIEAKSLLFLLILIMNFCKEKSFMIFSAIQSNLFVCFLFFFWTPSGRDSSILFGDVCNVHSVLGLATEGQIKPKAVWALHRFSQKRMNE